MADYIASVSGDWSNPATWGGSGPPGNGDRITINSNVVVDVTDSRIVGTSGVNGTVVVTINQTSSTTWGTLKIKSGGTLALRGDSTCNGVFQVEGGGVLEFDSSLAASPASTKYKITLSNGGNPGVARFVTANTSEGSRAAVRSNAGGGNGYITSANFRGYVDVDYVDFLRVGDATNDAIAIFSNGSTSQKCLIRHATFDLCGRYGPGTMTVDVEVRLEYIRSTNSAHATSVMNTSCAATGSATRTISHVSCDKAMIGTVALRGFALDHVVLPAGFLPLQSADVPPASMSKLWIRGTSGGASLSVSGDLTDSYLWIQPTSGTITNPHPVVPTGYRSVTIDGLIMEGGDRITTADGDWIIPTAAASPITLTVTRCLALPNGGDPTKHVGQIVSCLGSANTTIVFEHNTYVTSTTTAESGGPSYGETYDGHAGIFGSVKSNLAVGLAAGTGVIFGRRGNTTPVSNGVSVANCSHNGVHNAIMTSVGVLGYADQTTTPANPMFTSTTGLGANDVRADPQFVDPARNLATWAVSRGSAASTYAARCDDAQAYLLADPSLIDDLLAHVRGGLAPTNVLFRDAGHDGVTIGAFGWVSASIVPIFARQSYGSSLFSQVY